MFSRIGTALVRSPVKTAARGYSYRHFATNYKESDSLKIDVTASESYQFSGDLIAIPFYKPNDAPKEDQALADALKALIPDVGADLKSVIGDVLDEYSFKADASSKKIVRIFGNNSVKYLALIGLGTNPKKSEGDLEIQSALRLGKAVAGIAKEIKAASVGLVVPTGTSNAGLNQLFMGIHDSFYADNRYKKVPEGGFPANKLSKLGLLGCSTSVTSDIALTYKLSEMMASGVKFARDLVGAPSNSKTPVVIAELAKEMASEYKMTIEVLGEDECKALNMGGYLGVQQGSMFPPQFVHMTYKPENPTGEVVKVALVGKGLTFDSGGYNLKAGPGSMIEMMKFDMGGCAAVLGCAKTIAQLRPKNVEVHFITALCENMISSEAMRPGDVLVTSNGKTIEVANTDGEGRLTLSDALVYADKLGVDTIIDLATLTGASIVGLGDKLAAVYSPDDSLRDGLVAAAKRTSEGMWPMPLEPQYKDMIKSPIADLKNVGGRAGGSITAALFLQEFVEKAKWAHIDMAGPVWDNGPTGYGVKLLVDYLLNAKK